MDPYEVFDANNERLFSTDFDSLPEADRILLTICCLEADVNNGGFDQYFFNSSGDYAFFAEEALRKIGANQVADLVATAVATFGEGGVPRDRGERQEALDRLTSAQEQILEDLEDKFFEYPEDIAGLLGEYLQRATT